MRLSYDPETQRRCICCRAVGGQYQLVDVVGAVFPNGAVLLACGHIDSSLEAFRALHSEWWWVCRESSS